MTTLEDVGSTLWRGRAPLVIAAVIPLLVVAVLPWRALVLTSIPGFSGLWLATLILSDLLVAYLLIGQYRAGGSSRLVGVSWAYLWSAATAVLILFAAPGVISTSPDLSTDVNTTLWLWVWRHLFPPLLIGLALAPGRTREERGLRSLDRTAVSVASVGVIALATVGFTLVCTLAPSALPTVADAATGHLNGGVSAAVLVVTGVSVALAAVGVWRRGTHTLEAWAVVAAVTFLGDSLLTFLWEDRYTAAYYGARLLGLAASVFVLFALLHDIGRDHAAASDTTHRLAAQNADLLEAQRLRDHLTAVVSHDLRTPLAGLQGYLEMLRDDDLDAPLARHMLERSWMLTRRLTLLTEDLLAAATLENGDLVVSPERVDVMAVLGECASCFPDLDLELDCAPGLTAYADPLRLQQVLANLVRNAQKHGAEPVLIAATASAGGAVTIRVSDAGPGVPAAFVPRLFDRYSQGAATPTGGSGLGLSVVRDLVAAHRGSVRYDLSANAFEFTLPPASEPSASAPAAFPAPRAAARG